jgi:cytochrome c oxidase assembly protein subunit 11
MVGLTAASVPLYDLFCRVTGYGGTPQVGAADGVESIDRLVTVRFNADRAEDLPWSFQPEVRTVEVRLGEPRLAFYHARNLADEPIVGTAVFNVAPFKIGGYFTKIDCFCFEQQTLEPGEEAIMPVSFFVDPEMIKDNNTADVEYITLSYTFYVDEDATNALREARKMSQAPSIEDGRIEGNDIHG